jgi:hypothetical protein
VLSLLCATLLLVKHRRLTREQAEKCMIHHVLELRDDSTKIEEV